MTDPLELIIGTTLSSVFGNPLMLGAIGLIFITALGVALRLGFEAFVVVMLPFIFLLVIYGNLPPATLYAVLIGCGFIIFMAVMRAMRH